MEIPGVVKAHCMLIYRTARSCFVRAGDRRQMRAKKGREEAGLVGLKGEPGQLEGSGWWGYVIIDRQESHKKVRHQVHRH